MKKYKYILLIFLLLLSFQSVYAVENNYPEIKTPFGTYSINESSTLTDYVSYAFMMIIAMGAVILLVILIWSGVNFIMSGGDPGRISKAREMAINGFMGMIILLSVFLILNSINPGIINTENPNLSECSEGGILLTLNDGTNITKTCISQSSEKLNLTGDIIGTEWFYEKNDIKEVWAFTGENFTGTATSVYMDINPLNYIIPEKISGADIPSGTKSIYILPRLQGFYFYDSVNYGTTKERTFFVNQSVSNINETNRASFSKKASSFTSIYTPIQEGSATYFKQPKAVIFENANFSGKCSLLNSARSETLQYPTEFPDNNQGVAYFGNNKMSSIIVYSVEGKSDINQGKVVLYNTLSCAKESVSTNQQLSMCEIDIKEHKSQILNMKTKTSENFGSFPDGEGCSNWDGDSYVNSIYFPDGIGGVIVIGSNGTCAYFTPSSGKHCIGDLRGSGVYEGGSILAIRPEKVIVIPTN